MNTNRSRQHGSSMADRGLFTEILKMMWIKRRLSGTDYVPYMDLLEQLTMAMPQRYTEFLMVSTETDKPSVSDYYIGLPTIQLLDAFEGFEDVSESDLPKQIDVLHCGDQTKMPFTSRFEFRDR